MSTARSQRRRCPSATVREQEMQRIGERRRHRIAPGVLVAQQVQPGDARVHSSSQRFMIVDDPPDAEHRMPQQRGQVALEGARSASGGGRKAKPSRRVDRAPPAGWACRAPCSRGMSHLPAQPFAQALFGRVLPKVVGVAPVAGVAAAAAGRAAGVKFSLPHSEKIRRQEDPHPGAPALLDGDHEGVGGAERVAAWRLKFQRG